MLIYFYIVTTAVIGNNGFFLKEMTRWCLSPRWEKINPFLLEGRMLVSRRLVFGCWYSELKEKASKRKERTDRASSSERTVKECVAKRTCNAFWKSDG